jgi:hypothetical protein
MEEERGREVSEEEPGQAEGELTGLLEPQEQRGETF